MDFVKEKNHLTIAKHVDSNRQAIYVDNFFPKKIYKF